MPGPRTSLRLRVRFGPRPLVVYILIMHMANHGQSRIDCGLARTGHGPLSRSAAPTGYLTPLFHVGGPLERNLRMRLAPRRLETGTGAQSLKTDGGGHAYDAHDAWSCVVMRNINGNMRGSAFDWARGGILV